MNCFFENIIFVSTYAVITLYIIHIHYLLTYIKSYNCTCNNLEKLIYIRNWFFIYIIILSIIIIYNLLFSKLKYCINYLILIPNIIFLLTYIFIMITNIILIIYFYTHLQSLINKCDCIKNKYNEYIQSNTYKLIFYPFWFFFLIFIIFTILQIIYMDYNK
jgi:hypothetical protein